MTADPDAHAKPKSVMRERGFVKKHCYPDGAVLWRRGTHALCLQRKCTPGLHRSSGLQRTQAIRMTKVEVNFPAPMCCTSALELRSRSYCTRSSSTVPFSILTLFFAEVISEPCDVFCAVCSVTSGMPMTPWVLPVIGGRAPVCG